MTRKLLKLLAISAVAAALLAPGASEAQTTYSPSQTGAVGSIVTANDPNGRPRQVVEPHFVCDSGCAAPGLSTSGGWKYKVLNALSTTNPNPTTVKGTAGQLSTLQCYNPNTSQVYIQIFDNAAPTVGTTAPALSIPIAATATGGLALSLIGVQFSNAITVAATTTATGGAAPTTPVDCNAIYN